MRASSLINSLISSKKADKSQILAAAEEPAKIVLNTYKYLLYWVECPNFGHPALTSSFTKYEFFEVKKKVLQKL